MARVPSLTLAWPSGTIRLRIRLISHRTKGSEPNGRGAAFLAGIRRHRSLTEKCLSCCLALVKFSVLNISSVLQSVSIVLRTGVPSSLGAIELRGVGQLCKLSTRELVTMLDNTLGILRSLLGPVVWSLMCFLDVFASFSTILFRVLFTPLDCWAQFCTD